jgi:hypothetical protein
MMNATTLRIGQRLKVKLNAGVVEAVYQGAHPANEDYGLFQYEGKNFPRAFSRVENLNPDFQSNGHQLPTVQVTSQAGPVTIVNGAAPGEEEPEIHFNVNARFNFIERMVDMIVRDVQKSLIVTGSGGLGKSFTVFNRLKLNDLGDADYHKISGHMTPKALYRRLHESNGKLVVFDDCDSVLINETAVNLLKASLDSYGTRTLNWASELGNSEELPSTFEFTGRVIFISNFSLVDIPQPVVSRSLYVDVTMTPDEKIERIQAIAPALCPEMPEPDRNECIELLSKLRHKVSDLNLRTMMKVSAIRRANPREWREMATYMITAQLKGNRR